MFHLLPVRVWLLILFAVAAYAPARSLFEHFLPSRSDPGVNRPTGDFGMRPPQPLLRSWAILGALVALAIFIFTPAAAQFARSPSFFPMVVTAAAIASLYSVFRGAVTGQISPLTRGTHTSYERTTQPLRFWAAMGWNASFGILMLWAGYEFVRQAPRRAMERRCYDQRQAYSAHEEVAACSTVLDTNGLSRLNRAYWLSIRGIAYHRAGNYRQAIVDYGEALRLDPHDAITYYNRGLIEQDDNIPAAIADYTAAIRANPSDGDAYSRRGLLFLDARRWDDAIADFATEHRLHPRDPVPLANRAIAEAGKIEPMQSQRDLAAAGALDPTHLVVPRTAAYISMSSGDLVTAIARLDEALRIAPNDAVLLRWRAAAYRRTGDDARAKADTDAVQHLTGSGQERRD